MQGGGVNRVVKVLFMKVKLKSGGRGGMLASIRQVRMNLKWQPKGVTLQVFTEVQLAVVWGRTGCGDYEVRLLDLPLFWVFGFFCLGFWVFCRGPGYQAAGALVRRAFAVMQAADDRDMSRGA